MNAISRAAVLAGIVSVGACASGGYEGPQPVGTTGTVSNAPTDVGPSEPGVIPVGQEIDVRLNETLSSGRAKPEQRFTTTTVVDLKQGDAVLVPAGSAVRGIVSSVEPAGRIDRSGKLTLAFDQATIRGRNYPIRALATQVFESGGIREEAATVGTAGAVGAIVGGIIGGLKGAVIGAAIGSGGVIAATEGKDIELPAGAIVRLRLDSPMRIR